MIKLKTLLLEARLHGEWWIDDTGGAQFADGDVGDMNHEGYVIQLLTHQILEHFDIGNDEDGSLGDFEQEIGESLKDKGDIQTEEQMEEYIEDPSSYMLKILQRDKFTPDDKQTEDALFIAYGSVTTRDARSYSMKYWGWKAVRGSVIQTWNLTRQDLDAIVRGLGDAYNEALDETDPDEITDDNPEGHRTFELEVFSTRSVYRHIPLPVLEKRDPTALNPYRTRY
jgi:hypothetical protein